MDNDRQSGSTLAWWMRGILVVVPLGVGLPLVLLAEGYLPHLIGVAACALAFYGLASEVFQQVGAGLARPRRERPSWSLWLERWLPPLLLAGLAAGLLWPCLIGRMPVSQDHPVHLTRAWHFVTRMLAHGRLSGWSDLWFAGWPAGEDYPPGGDLWVSTFYLGTFGLLGWEGAYALAFVAVLAVASFAVYGFGRVYFGLAGGLLAGAFFLLDRGAYREGGWSYTVWWGVWPQILSTALTFGSFALLKQVLERGRPRDYALCALAAGFALLSHPVATICFGIGLPLFLLVRLLAEDGPAGRAIVRTIAAFALAFALAAFWVLPYGAKSAWMAKYGELWKSLPEMASAIWSGTLFQNVEPPILWFSIAGGALAAWRRNFAGIFLALLALVLLFAASSTAFQRLELMELSPALGQIQYQRLVIPAKICVFLLAGYALQALFAARGASGAGPGFKPLRRYGLMALVVVAAAPFIEPLGKHWGRTYGAELGRPKTRNEVPHWDDYRRFLDWSKRQHARESAFYRIAYALPYHDHSFASAPVYNHTPAYKVGFMPCTTFLHKPEQASPELYRVLSVKYVVTLGHGGGPRTEQVERFGPINVYRFLDYSPTRYTLEGSGKVEVLRFDPEGGEIRLRLSAVEPGARLILHQAPYPNWRASLDGKPLEISTALLAGQSMFAAVPVSNGVLTFRYVWPWVNVVGTVSSWGAVLLLAVLLVAPLRRALLARSGGKIEACASWLERRGVVIGAALALAVLLGGALKIAAGRGDRSDGTALIDALESARVEVVRGGKATVCPWQRERRHQCADGSWNYVGVSVERVGRGLRRCIWAHPVDAGQLQITFPKVELGRSVAGFHGLTDDAARSAGGAPVQLEVRIDGQSRGVFTRPNAPGWEPWLVKTAGMEGAKVDLTFVVKAARSGVRHYCFDATIVR